MLRAAFCGCTYVIQTTSEQKTAHYIPWIIRGITEHSGLRQKSEVFPFVTEGHYIHSVVNGNGKRNYTVIKWKYACIFGMSLSKKHAPDICHLFHIAYMSQNFICMFHFDAFLSYVYTECHVVSAIWCSAVMATIQWPNYSVSIISEYSDKFNNNFAAELNESTPLW